MLCCFLHRKKDGAIGMIGTDDIDKIILKASREHGAVELLGVMPFGEELYQSFWQSYGMYKWNDEDEWLMPMDEIYAFIHENAIDDEDPIKLSAQYKASSYTPIKQRALEAALQQQMDLVVTITKRFYRPRPYLYFDLNAGPGVSGYNEPGSPVIFRKIADDHQKSCNHFHYEANLYEADRATYLQLHSVLGHDPRYTLHNSDHATLKNYIQAARKTIPQNKRDWVFGAVYADPSNASLPWEILEDMNNAFPRVDVMINIACASYKRTIATAGYRTLADRLPQIKDHWIVRKPVGKHQWSILIGTNWPDYPAWKEQDFYPWNDKGLGTHYFEKMVYTPDQLQAKLQPRLFD